MGSPEPDWLGFCRRAGEGARAALGEFSGAAQRAREISRGQGGDMTLAIDEAVEEVIFSQLEALETGLVAVSEERGLVELHGGGETHVVIDPIDGSLNAKRGLPPYAISIAAGGGKTLADMTFGYVADLATGGEWWAERGGGAFHNGTRLDAAAATKSLELIGVESAQPDLVEAAVHSLAQTQAHRLRIVGSIALSLCYVASGYLDAMLSLRDARSVDFAAAQLVVREAGGAVSFPEAGGESLSASIGLEMRSRVLAGSTPALLSQLPTAAPHA